MADQMTSTAAEVSQMLSLITSYRVTQVIHVAARLGVATLLADGERSTDWLAERTRTHGPSLYRVLRALGGLGLVREVEPGAFALTPLGQTLRGDAAGSRRAWAATADGEGHWDPWGRSTGTAETDAPDVDQLFGRGPFAYHRERAEVQRIFLAALSGLTEMAVPAILEAYDFGAFRKVVDLGGGTGRLLAALLQAHPQMRGILFDRSEVIERARSLFAEADVQGRCELVAGDFLRGVPAGADAYIMRHILHDWDDECSIVILRQCRRTLAGHGRVLVIESGSPPDDAPFCGKLLDFEMLIGYAGRERTAGEYRALLAEAGFEVTCVIETGAFVRIVEAVAA